MTNKAAVVTTKGPTMVEVTLLWADIPMSSQSTQVWVSSEALRACRFQVLGEAYGGYNKRWRIHCVTPLDSLPPGMSQQSLMRLKAALHTEVEKMVLLPVTQWSYELIDTGTVVPV